MSRTLPLGDQYALLSTPRPGGRLFCTATTLRCSTLTMDDIHEGSEAPTAPADQDCYLMLHARLHARLHSKKGEMGMARPPELARESGRGMAPEEESHDCTRHWPVSYRKNRQSPVPAQSGGRSNR